MKDDPLVQIKEMELEQRRQVINNPMTLKRIREEIEALKNGGARKRSTSRERHRKSNRRSTSRDRDTHQRRRSSESDDPRRKESRRERRQASSESSRETRRHDRYRERRDSRDRHERRRHHYSRRDRDRSSESSRERYYRRKHHRDEERHRRRSPVDNQKLDDQKKDLGPDMRVYGDRLKEIKEMEQLRRDRYKPNTASRLTQEQKEQMAL